MRTLRYMRIKFICVSVRLQMNVPALKLYAY